MDLPEQKEHVHVSYSGCKGTEEREKGNQVKNKVRSPVFVCVKLNVKSVRVHPDPNVNLQTVVRLTDMLKLLIDSYSCFMSTVPCSRVKDCLLQIFGVY